MSGKTEFFGGKGRSTDSRLQERVRQLHKAGPRIIYTEQEFLGQIMKIGLNVYEKQILPWELGSAPKDISRRQGI